MATRRIKTVYNPKKVNKYALFGMSGDIIQINLHKSMLAMVELNRHVKHAYNTDNVRTRAGDVDGPGGGVDVEGGRSSVRIYRNHKDNSITHAYNTVNVCTRADGGVDGPGGGVDVEGGRSGVRIHRNIDINRQNVRIVDGDGPGGGVDVDGERSIRIYRNIDKNRKKEQNWSNNGDGGVARAPDGHGGGRGSPTRGGDERGVGDRGRVRPDGWDHPKPRGRAETGLFNHINESSISGVRDAVYNDIVADIDGVDQAPAAHGGGGVDLADGAARLGVGGRGRHRPGGLAGEPRHQYHLCKDNNEHNILDRGDFMHNVHVNIDGVDGVDQAPVAHGGDGVDLVDGAARLEVGGRGRRRPGGLAGEPRHQYHLYKNNNEHSILDRGNIIMHNVRVRADIDGVDQAPVTHGGDGVDLIDGAARLEVGGRGRRRPGGLAGEPRHQYRLNKDKKEHSISKRGNTMHNVRVRADIDGVDQAPVAHGGGRVGLVDGAAQLGVGGRGRHRLGGLDGGPRHQHRLHKDKNEHRISDRGNIMHNIRGMADNDGVDQAPGAHGGGR